MTKSLPSLEQMASGINVNDIDKIGNLINYLSKNIPHLYATKLLKLLYIIDEKAVRETGAPVTWLNYNVWEKGPVATPIYNNLTFNKADAFEHYFYVIQINNTTKVKHQGEFDDSEFTDYEMELIDSVVQEYKYTSSQELIDLLHEPDTLWSKVVEKEGLKEKFENDEYHSNTSPFLIDLADATPDDNKRNYYKYAVEQKSFYDSLR